ncbi:hypothetical protein C8R43DRAFT_961533 [Mycena crocata]|nr:hypothetical protein C8R43DRAFT_961533 [Mycena crocata]
MNFPREHLMSESESALEVAAGLSTPQFHSLSPRFPKMNFFSEHLLSKSESELVDAAHCLIDLFRIACKDSSYKESAEKGKDKEEAEKQIIKIICSMRSAEDMRNLNNAYHEKALKPSAGTQSESLIGRIEADVAENLPLTHRPLDLRQAVLIVIKEAIEDPSEINGAGNSESETVETLFKLNIAVKYEMASGIGREKTEKLLATFTRMRYQPNHLALKGLALAYNNKYGAQSIQLHIEGLGIRNNPVGELLAELIQPLPTSDVQSGDEFQ